MGVISGREPRGSTLNCRVGKIRAGSLAYGVDLGAILWERTGRSSRLGSG